MDDSEKLYTGTSFQKIINWSIGSISILCPFCSRKTSHDPKEETFSETSFRFFGSRISQQICAWKPVAYKASAVPKPQGGRNLRVTEWCNEIEANYCQAKGKNIKTRIDVLIHEVCVLYIYIRCICFIFHALYNSVSKSVWKGIPTAKSTRPRRRRAFKRCQRWVQCMRVKYIYQKKQIINFYILGMSWNGPKPISLMFPTYWTSHIYQKSLRSLWKHQNLRTIIDHFISDCRINWNKNPCRGLGLHKSWGTTNLCS